MLRLMVNLLDLEAGNTLGVLAAYVRVCSEAEGGALLGHTDAHTQVSQTRAPTPILSS